MFVRFTRRTTLRIRISSKLASLVARYVINLQLQLTKNNELTIPSRLNSLLNQYSPLKQRRVVLLAERSLAQSKKLRKGQRGRRLSGTWSIWPLLCSWLCSSFPYLWWVFDILWDILILTVMPRLELLGLLAQGSILRSTKFGILSSAQDRLTHQIPESSYAIMVMVSCSEAYWYQFSLVMMTLTLFITFWSCKFSTCILRAYGSMARKESFMLWWNSLVSTDVKLQFSRFMAVVVPKMCLYKNQSCSATRPPPGSLSTVGFAWDGGGDIFLKMLVVLECDYSYLIYEST